MRNTFHPSHKIIITKRIDRIALVVGVLQPLTTLPQIYLVYSTHSATGVSLAMWIGYNIGSVVFLAYGIRHKLRPIIWTQIFWLLVQTPMMISVFIFY